MDETYTKEMCEKLIANGGQYDGQLPVPTVIRVLAEKLLSACGRLEQADKRYEDITGGMMKKQIKQKKEQTGHPRFYKILEELAIIHSTKNHDYAQAKSPLSNLTRSERIGVPAWIGCLIRMQDKFDRIENFAKQRNLAIADETITDTLNDLANYSILCRILYDESKKANKD